MKNKKMSKMLAQVMLVLICLVIMAPIVSYAADSNGGSAQDMPWEKPLDKLQKSLSGPVAQAIAVGSIIMSGCALAFGEGGSGVRKLIQIVFGISVALGAATFVTKLFAACAF